MNLPSFGLPLFEGAKVLVVGDVMLDRYWFGDVERISPEAPVPVLKVARVEERPGGAANVARNIASLGAHCTLLSVVGDDEAGACLEGLLNKHENLNTLLHREEHFHDRKIAGYCPAATVVAD